jgi:hypothetical protein
MEVRSWTKANYHPIFEFNFIPFYNLGGYGYGGYGGYGYGHRILVNHEVKFIL